MKSLTQKSPKCLLKVKDKPLLDWQLKAIRGAGIKNIAIVTGYKREMLKKYQLVEFHNDKWQTSQMVYSLFCAKKWLFENDCIISYSDIFYQKSAIALLKENKDDIAITYDPNWKKLWEKRFHDPLQDAESFKLNKDNQLIDIGNKEVSIKNIEGQYMGLIKISSKGISHLQELFDLQENFKKENIDMTELLKIVLKVNKFKINAYPYKDIWGEVDSKSDLEYYNIL